MVDNFAEINTNQVQEYMNQVNQSRQNAQAELKREWGPAYDKNLNMARAAVRDFGGEEAFQILNQYGLGDNPVILKMLAKAGSTLGEDKISGNGNNSLEITAEQAQVELAQIMGNQERPYWKGPAHPGYEKDKARILYLQGVLTGEVQ